MIFHISPPLLYIGVPDRPQTRSQALDSRLAAEYFSVPLRRSSCISSNMMALTGSCGRLSFQPRSSR